MRFLGAGVSREPEPFVPLLSFDVGPLFRTLSPTPSVKRSRRTSKLSSDLYRFGSIGTQFAATLGVFGGAGWWLDGRFGSSPWLLIAGVFLGFGLGLYSMLLKLSPDRARPDDGDEPRRPSSPST